MKITSLIILVSISIVSYSQSSDESTIKKVNVDVEKMKTEREHQIKSVQVSSTSNNEGSKEIVKTLQNKPNQTQSYSISNNRHYDSETVGKDITVQDKAYFESELDRIDGHINAINAKMASVNLNEEEKAKAIESDWFNDMEKIKSELENEKIEIQSTLIKLEK